MDPEIAAARAVNEQQAKDLVKVSDAWQMWLERTERKFGKWGIYPQYKSLKNFFERWTLEEGIEYIQEIKPIQLERWYSSHNGCASNRGRNGGALCVVFLPTGSLLER
jgi:hypothetical protein